MPLRFNMLLAEVGIKPTDVRLIRHQTNKVSGKTPYSLWRDNRSDFEVYQSTQDSEQRARFNGRYWASFVSPPQGGTLFIGLYEVSRSGSVPKGTIDPYTKEPIGRNSKVPYDQYEYSLTDKLSEYIGRLHIKWGDSPSAYRAWIQKAEKQDKEIIELTTNLQEDPFPGFTKFIRPLSEIETMPASWQGLLAATRGVYLLTCPSTGKHYVGSAYSEGGFMSRWQEYVRDNHGGNVKLMGRPWSDYFISVLEAAGSSATKEEIIALEHLWMNKLLSRSIGFN